MSKKTLLLLSTAFFFNLQNVGAMEPSHEEKKDYEKNKKIILYLKDNDVDISKARIQENRYFFNPYRVFSPYSERYLEDKDLSSTAVRGFMLGFSESLIDCTYPSGKVAWTDEVMVYKFPLFTIKELSDDRISLNP